jgi:hypothetical protein
LGVAQRGQAFANRHVGLTLWDRVVEDKMSEDIIREGGCACGAVRYRVSGEPINVNNCHCRQCQCQTGSTSVVNAFFEAERVTHLAACRTRAFGECREEPLRRTDWNGDLTAPKRR